MGVHARRPTGFCATCGRDAPLKLDRTVYRHPQPGHKDGDSVCEGSGTLPSHVFGPNGEIVEYDNVPISWFGNRSPNSLTGPRDAKTKYDQDEQVGLRFGTEVPVFTEFGTVIGRARIEFGRVVILGHRWASRTA